MKLQDITFWTILMRQIRTLIKINKKIEFIFIIYFII